MSTTSGKSPHNLGAETEDQTTDQWELVEELVDQAVRSQSESSETYEAQQTLYRFFLEVVKQWPSEEVLLEFKRLLFYQTDLASPETVQAVYQLVFQNDEAAFRNTLKRCCYILINNWDVVRQYKAIQDLIQAFQDFTIEMQSISPGLKRLKNWIENFRNSKDYDDLELFTTRYGDQKKEKWIGRYTSYLLVPQFVDLKNPIEQREAARALSRQLKDRFKFDLAMYIAKSQSAPSTEKMLKNPTVLGDNVLMLIKAIVAKRGQYSYENLASIFINQIQNLSYKDFKQSLQRYLIFSIAHDNDFSIAIHSKLAEKLDSLYSNYERIPLNDALILRTCNRIIEALTTENRKDPAPLFIMLLSQGNPMMLVVVLLKLILICNASRSHLEAQIAVLIRYYERLPEQDCSWVVNFLEIFNVTFAIHAENVQYNLVKMQRAQESASQTKVNLDHYRIFSQMKPIIRPKLPAASEPSA